MRNMSFSRKFGKNVKNFADFFPFSRFLKLTIYFPFLFSDVFPTGTEAETKEKAALQTLKKVQTISDFSAATNTELQDCKKCQNGGSDSKCVYYVSDDEINDVKACKRAIMRPRRSRKYRHDSFKENEQEQESEDNEPKSPILPWKKDTTAAAPPSPLSMVIFTKKKSFSRF